jgi:membrane protein
MFKIEKFKQAVSAALWRRDLDTLPFRRSALLRILRIGYVVVRDLVGGQLTLRAMSLVYTTVLSMVPLLAVSFSVLKGFGIHNRIEPALMNFLAPLGDKGAEITQRVIGFVENVNVTVLGSLGIALLFYTVVSLIRKIEHAFNLTWHIKQLRPFWQRFSDYLIVIMIGPLLVLAALGITGTLLHGELAQRILAIEPFGSLVAIAGRLLPYLLIITAFTFVYTFVPNTRVSFGSALTGGILAGILWESTGWAFASFVIASTKYTAIYSTFATLIMFMIWLYLSWLILLIGASIAFYHQHPEYVTEYTHDLRLSNRLKETASLQIACLIGRHYYAGRPGWSVEALAQHLTMPIEPVQTVLSALEQHGLLIRTLEDPPAYLPGHPPETTLLSTLLIAVRSAGETPQLNPDTLQVDAVVASLRDAMDRAQAGALAGRTWKDLATDEAPDSSAAGDGRDHPGGRLDNIRPGR